MAHGHLQGVSVVCKSLGKNQSNGKNKASVAKPWTDFPRHFPFTKFSI